MPDPFRASSFIGFRTLLHKEVLRFWKVSFQTVVAQVLNALLFLLIFSHVLDRRAAVHGEVPYTTFLVPGLVMMSLLQNAFANASSSLIQSKITGNILFVLLPPLSCRTFYAAYVLAAVLRGLFVAAGVWLVSALFVAAPLAHPAWALAFAILGAALLATFGVIAGIWADTFDQLAAVHNFFVIPATMLSGVFYSLHSLPPLWQKISHFNPFFFMIDGFRHGFFGQSDTSPWLSLTVTGGCLVVLAALALAMLARGYKLRG
ncbi:MAG: ABC transporter permease [Azoarcus sp.]|jgi:ABC-2 type transport system permease protein|nr:ABC transporter permease [Azoarcus sp.]